MAKINTSKKQLSRYQEVALISAIENLSRVDKKNRLLFCPLDVPLVVSYDAVKVHLKDIVKFRLTSIHYKTIKETFNRYNIKVQYNKRISSKVCFKTDILNESKNHYIGHCCQL